jgi:ribosomal protein S18 acetylase RimI-like enzyme
MNVERMQVGPNEAVVVEAAFDVSELVKIHQLAFPGFYLTLMGSAFLYAYYANVLRYPKRIALVAKRGGVTIGFVVGFLEPEEFYAQFRAERLRLLPIIALALLRRPALIGRTFNNSRRVQRVTGAPDTAELSSIAVNPATRGVGSVLLDAFLKQARELEARLVVLTTDALNNERVNQFYLKHGFERVREYDDHGRAMNEYNLHLKR